jgi:hypothetical protein
MTPREMVIGGVGSVTGGTDMTETPFAEPKTQAGDDASSWAIRPVVNGVG